MRTPVTAAILAALTCTTARTAPSDHLGFPDRSGDVDVLEGFREPPRGYGNVPFYWWNGDPLTRERLLWQLDQLAAAGTDGFGVSYIHSHVQADPELNAGGYAAFGKTVPGSPPVFSDPWWELWNWFSAECAKRGMGLGLDDYTMNWPGNGYWPDEVKAVPKLENYHGRIEIRTVAAVRGGDCFERAIERDSTVALRAYPKMDDALHVEGAVDLLAHAAGGAIRWSTPPRPCRRSPDTVPPGRFTLPVRSMTRGSTSTSSTSKAPGSASWCRRLTTAGATFASRPPTSCSARKRGSSGTRLKGRPGRAGRIRRSTTQPGRPSRTPSARTCGARRAERSPPGNRMNSRGAGAFKTILRSLEGKGGPVRFTARGDGLREASARLVVR